MFGGRGRSEKASIIVDYISHDSPYRLNEQQRHEYYPNIADTLRSLKVEIRSCNTDSDMTIQSKEKQEKVNVVILQSLSYL